MSDTSTDKGFNPKECPVGQMNELKIEHTEDRLSAMIERIEGRLEETRGDIASLSKNIDAKFEKVDHRFDEMDCKIEKLKESIPITASEAEQKIAAAASAESAKREQLKKEIPEIINEQLNIRQGATASQAIKWVICGFGSSLLITLAGAWLKMKLGL